MSRHLNILYTRDLQKRLDELEGLRDAVEEAKRELDESKASEGLESEDDDEKEAALDEVEEKEAHLKEVEQEYSQTEADELAEIESISNQIHSFRDGESMIDVDDFEEWAEQYAEDIGAIHDAKWPCNHIDWKAAARELQSDYSEVEYQGTKYYVRNS